MLGKDCFTIILNVNSTNNNICKNCTTGALGFYGSGNTNDYLIIHLHVLKQRVQILADYFAEH